MAEIKRLKRLYLLGNIILLIISILLLAMWKLLDGGFISFVAVVLIILFVGLKNSDRRRRKLREILKKEGFNVEQILKISESKATIIKKPEYITTKFLEKYYKSNKSVKEVTEEFIKE